LDETPKTVFIRYTEDGRVFRDNILPDHKELFVNPEGEWAGKEDDERLKEFVRRVDQLSSWSHDSATPEMKLAYCTLIQKRLDMMYKVSTPNPGKNDRYKLVTTKCWNLLRTQTFKGMAACALHLFFPGRFATGMPGPLDAYAGSTNAIFHVLLRRALKHCLRLESTDEELISGVDRLTHSEMTPEKLTPDEPDLALEEIKRHLISYYLKDHEDAATKALIPNVKDLTPAQLRLEVADIIACLQLLQNPSRQRSASTTSGTASTSTSRTASTSTSNAAASTSRRAQQNTAATSTSSSTSQAASTSRRPQQKTSATSSTQSRSPQQSSNHRQKRTAGGATAVATSSSRKQNATSLPCEQDDDADDDSSYSSAWRRSLRELYLSRSREETKRNNLHENARKARSMAEQACKESEETHWKNQEASVKSSRAAEEADRQVALAKQQLQKAQQASRQAHEVDDRDREACRKSNLANQVNRNARYLFDDDFHSTARGVEEAERETLSAVQAEHVRYLQESRDENLRRLVPFVQDLSVEDRFEDEDRLVQLLIRKWIVEQNKEHVIVLIRNGEGATVYRATDWRDEDECEFTLLAENLCVFPDKPLLGEVTILPFFWLADLGDLHFLSDNDDENHEFLNSL